MEIVFDTVKRGINLKTHDLDFADLTEEWFSAARVLPAKQNRLMAIGQFDDIIIAVVFRPLGTEAISVISMRHASPKERKIL